MALTAAGSSAVWAQLAAWRCGERRPGLTVRALLAGAAAFGFALAAYHFLALAGWPVRWASLAGGGGAALLAAGAIGLVEEGAKLAGILLVLDGRFRARSAAAAAAGVSAGFAALEAVVVLREASAAALARAALAPVAHALLAVPLAAGVIAWGCRRERRLRVLALALAGSAALHGASDLALAVRGLGQWAYAGALLAPALALFASSGKRKGPLGWRTLIAHRGRPLLGSPAGGRSCV